MPSATLIDNRFADLDFVEAEGTRARAVARGSRVLAGGILAVAAATSAGVVAPRSAFSPVDALVLAYQPGTGTSTAIHPSVASILDADSLATAETILAEIRSVLGLNVADTARIVRVERPTIYSWLAGRSTPQRSKAVRLTRLQGVVGMWRRLAGSAPSPMVRAPGRDGRSLVDLLSDDPIPEALVEARLREIASAKAAPRREAVREVAARHGIALKSEVEGQREIDWLTRRPFGAEES